MKTKILNAFHKISKKHPKLKGIKISIKEKKDHSVLKIKSGFRKHKIILDKEKEKHVKKFSPKQLEKFISKNITHALENQTLPMIQLIGIALEYTLSPGKHNIKELIS